MATLWIVFISLSGSILAGQSHDADFLTSHESHEFERASVLPNEENKRVLDTFVLRINNTAGKVSCQK